MTVQELIEKLSNEDPNATVAVGCEVTSVVYHPVSGFGGELNTDKGSIFAIYVNDRQDIWFQYPESEENDG